jgi:hypothetical protein
MGSKLLGASFNQIRKLGLLILKAAKLPLPDSMREYVAELKLRGKTVGKATYSTVVYKKLRDLPAISKNSRSGGRP